jgi:hypothetical protein
VTKSLRFQVEYVAYRKDGKLKNRRTIAGRVATKELAMALCYFLDAQPRCDLPRVRDMKIKRR